MASRRSDVLSLALLIVLGNGSQGNFSVIVGKLYEQATSARRGFRSFNGASNSARFHCPLICGYLGQQINWNRVFEAAASAGRRVFQYVLGSGKLVTRTVAGPVPGAGAKWRRQGPRRGCMRRTGDVVAGRGYTGLVPFPRDRCRCRRSSGARHRRVLWLAVLVGRWTARAQALYVIGAVPRRLAVLVVFEQAGST